MSAGRIDEQGQSLARNGVVASAGRGGLLLDFGAVITFSIFERHRHIEQVLGLPAGTLKWQGPIAPHTDSLWQSMQRDEISEREYWARRAAEIGRLVGANDWDMRAFLARVREENPADVVRPEMRALIGACRARGIAVGILSNEMELFYGARFLAGMDLLQHMDAIVDGTHTGILKPDPRSYARALELMRLNPADVLFVDDQLRNIDGAVRAGLKTLHFDLRDVRGSIAAIGARLGLPMQEQR